jgi:hypothetical protein
MAFTYEVMAKSAALWAADVTTVLKPNQEGVESDTGKRKLGDGTSLWGALAYGTATGGNVTGQSSSVDSEIALFSSTTGKVIKRATTTGLLKATSGVLSAASPGTDYVAPLFIAQLNTTQTTSNSTTDTTHWTPANVAAGSLTSGVTLFRARIGGNFDNKATSGTFTGRLKVNGTTVQSVPIAISQTSLQTATTWWVDMDVYIDTTGAGGVVSVLLGAIEVTNAAAGQNPRSPHTIATSVNLTAGCQFTWTVQMGTADAANITRTFRGVIQQIA